mgnify:FL=1
MSDNIWEVSDAEYDVDSISDFEPTEPVEQQTEEPIEHEQDEQVYEDEPEHQEEHVDVNQDAQESEDEVEDTGSDSATDYESQYKKIVGTPFKANGKEITVDSAEDAIKLMQMGANYHKQMQQLKPAKRIIAMLEQAGMLDENKLNHAIDIMNGNSAAIHKLIQERNVDVSDLYSDSEVDYTPNQHQVTDERIELDTLFNELNSTSHGQRVLQEVAGTWDEKSRYTIGQTPEILRLLSNQIESGIYDVIVAEVDKQRMLGNIPANAPMLQAYEQVGKYLQANGRLIPAGSNVGKVPTQQPKEFKQHQATVPSNGSNTRKRVANTARSSTSSISTQMDNVFAMSDEDFKRKYS